jgi:hypothetical protein
MVVVIKKLWAYIYLHKIIWNPASKFVKESTSSNYFFEKGTLLNFEGLGRDMF